MKNKDKQINTEATYSYDMPIRVIADKYKVTFSMPASTKLGDFFKKNGAPSLAKMLRE